MRKSNDRSIKEVIDEILKTNKLKGRLDEVKLKSTWERLMGKVVANRTQNLFLKEGVLFIKINSAPLSTELHYGAEKIRQLINTEFGEDLIKEVKII